MILGEMVGSVGRWMEKFDRWPRLITIRKSGLHFPPAAIHPPDLSSLKI